MPSRKFKVTYAACIISYRTALDKLHEWLGLGRTEKTSEEFQALPATYANTQEDPVQHSSSCYSEETACLVGRDPCEKRQHWIGSVSLSNGKLWGSTWSLHLTGSIYKAGLSVKQTEAERDACQELSGYSQLVVIHLQDICSLCLLYSKIVQIWDVPLLMQRK